MSVLPSDETTFNLKVEGNKTKRLYEGSFTFKMPDLAGESIIDKRRARMNEGLTLESHIDFLHEMVSFLSYTLIDSPKWWKEEGLNLLLKDINVYQELWKNCKEFENKWIEEVWGTDEKSEESSKPSE